MCVVLSSEGMGEDGPRPAFILETVEAKVKAKLFA
jgi:hypothetical protein